MRHRRHRIRRYGNYWIIVSGHRAVTYRYHRHWFGAFIELLRLRGWL